jgi:hypothetical protein
LGITTTINTRRFIEESFPVKEVGEAKGAYAADGLKAVVQAWEQSSKRLNAAVNALLQRLS